MKTNPENTTNDAAESIENPAENTHQEKKIDTQYCCPNCMSTNVENYYSESDSMIKVLCFDCKYWGNAGDPIKTRISDNLGFHTDAKIR